MSFKLDLDELERLNIKSLFKFKMFDNKNYYKDLLNNRLWMASRIELNDPFDCRVNLNYELCSESELKIIMNNQLSWIPWESIRTLIVDSQYKHRKNNLDEYHSYYERMLDKGIGVFSLSQEMSEYLWTNYAGNHSGFCLEFDAGKLLSSLDHKLEVNKIKIIVHRVHYFDILPEVNPCKATLDEKSQLFLLKTKSWEKEKEWRVVWLDGIQRKNRIETIESDCIKAIYFGYNASGKNIKTSIDILNYSNSTLKYIRK